MLRLVKSGLHPNKGVNQAGRSPCSFFTLPCIFFEGVCIFSALIDSCYWHAFLGVYNGLQSILRLGRRIVLKSTKVLKRPGCSLKCSSTSSKYISFFLGRALSFFLSCRFFALSDNRLNISRLSGVLRKTAKSAIQKSIKKQIYFWPTMACFLLRAKRLYISSLPAWYAPW